MAMARRPHGGRRRIDFTLLVNKVADRFQDRAGMVVDTGARELLVTTALPYRDHVEQELSAGAITMEFLEQCLREVLENAQTVASEWGRGEIDEGTTKESMARYCPYFPWC